MYNFKNKNLFSGDLFNPDKSQRYYYDFGTGNKIERKEVKEERDAFLEGFNFSETVTESEKERERKTLPFKSPQEVKIEKLPYNTGNTSPVMQYENEKTSDMWGPSLGGDLNSNKDKELFLEGFMSESKQPQSKPQTTDAIEFGENSETYKILQDLSKRWYATSDSAEKDRLHGVAEEVRRLARGKNRVRYAHDDIFELLHRNAKTAQEYQNELKKIESDPLFETGSTNHFLDTATYLIGMTDHGDWDYKRKDEWRPTKTYLDKNDNTRRYDGKNLDAYNQKNYIEWMYFDGYLIGADKLGNMNMAYVGDKMGLPEWVYNNFLTRDKDDTFWVEYGRDLSRSGR